jgi:hypothetical protein
LALFWRELHSSASHPNVPALQPPTTSCFKQSWGKYAGINTEREPIILLLSSVATRVRSPSGIGTAVSAVVPLLSSHGFIFKPHRPICQPAHQSLRRRSNCNPGGYDGVQCGKSSAHGRIHLPPKRWEKGSLAPDASTAT